MFCPKCSQEQVSDETRFCSRCGFQLNGVKALLCGEGVASSGEIQKQASALRKRDLTIGAALMFFFALIMAILTVSFPPASSFRIIYLVIAWLALTLLINIKPIIRFFLGGETSAADEKLMPAKFTSAFASQTGKQPAALPAAHESIPADFLMPAANTAEMVPPPSVTESTTNLLKK
ncbi:MAG TPA: zinc ribbon domain-containing protein [Pyrinomonadaceae bacterium]|jgi:hypothetical protein